MVVSIRHATNVFADFDRQTAINLFLGLIDPKSEDRSWLIESGSLVIFFHEKKEKE